MRDALHLAVTTICGFTGWPLGHVLLIEERGGELQLRSAAIWYADVPERFQAFCQSSEGMAFKRGAGLPGRVWETRTAAWIINTRDDSNFPRLPAARPANLRAAFAFPILIGTEVTAVLEFFIDKELEPDQQLLYLAPQIGTLLSRVVERKRTEERLIHDASHDALTGLPNRSLLLDRLTRVVARTKRHPKLNFAVLFIDLDRFKIVNDSLGHQAGDELIVAVTARFLASLRREDLIARDGREPAEEEHSLARIGGDEFTVLLDDLRDPSDAARVAKRIHDSLKQPFSIGGKSVYVSASIGIASSTSGYSSAHEVLRDADIAMYRAKALGKARSEVYDRTMHHLAMQHLKLESDLRRALHDGDFVLYYQPIVALADCRIVGFEGLVRWHRSEEVVPASEFIPLAEDTGLILDLGAWVLREACRTLRRWHDEFPREQPLTMSANVSARQFAQPELVAQVGAILADTGVDPAALTLEITETATMGDAERAVRVLCDLRSLGVRLSIDDFGTGYSSLSYLHRFPLDVLKIDQSFVTDIETRTESRQVVRTIMNLARQMGLAVVAEGVETYADAAQVKSLGCQFGQGYYFSRPVDATAAQALLQSATLPAVTAGLASGPTS